WGVADGLHRRRRGIGWGGHLELRSARRRHRLLQRARDLRRPDLNGLLFHRRLPRHRRYGEALLARPLHLVVSRRTLRLLSTSEHRGRSKWNLMPVGQLFYGRSALG